VPTSLEFIEASQINDFFSNLDSFENSSGIDSYWQILPYDDLNYRLIFSFINNLNEEFTFTNEAIILAKLKFQVSQIEINTDSLLIQFKPEGSKYYWYGNENSTSFSSSMFDGYHGAQIKIMR